MDINAWMRELFARPLYNLGDEGNAALNEIYSPGYSKELLARYMTKYYGSIDGARSQAEKIDLTGYYHGLISEALADANFKHADSSSLDILEIGCGFGSATFPLIQLMPHARLVATELSMSMLIVLNEQLKAKGERHRCALLQLNAEELDFKDGSFDLIVGAAILHHLLEPEIVIARCAKLLNPGGIAIFFEPFENGYKNLGTIYQAILNDRRSWLLWPWNRRYFKNCIKTWKKMSNTNKSDPFFSYMDDKWLFTRDFFVDLAKKYKFSDVSINRLSKSDEPFFQFAEDHIKGNNVNNLPSWVWNLIHEQAHHISIDLKMDLLIEGCIIFKK